MRMLKILGSGLICFHVFAVAVAPLSMPPASESVQAAWSWCRPYLEVAYLNHGYHFFAPDPGPSSMIEFSAKTAQGNKWGRLPDRTQQWPRLLYHRHFMLTEFYGGIPPTAAESRSVVAQTYAQQLMKKYGAESVELTHVIHNLSSRQEILAGQELNDPHKYEFTELGTFSMLPTDSMESELEGGSESVPAPLAEAPPAVWHDAASVGN